MTATRGLTREEIEALEPVGRGLFSVDGMWCPSCAAATERVIAKTPGVLRARVSYATASALIDWDPAQARLSRIVQAVQDLGYAVGGPQSTAETVEGIDRDLAALSIRLAVALFFGMWVMVLAVMRYLEPQALGDTQAGHILSLVAAGLALPVVTFAAAPFWLAGWRTLKAGVPGMDTLVSLGVAGAGMLTIVELAGGGAHIYADTAVMLVTLLTIGRLVEMRTTRRAATAIGLLEREMPERAFPAQGGPAQPADSFDVGALIQVSAGARVPLDGVVTAARTRLDCSVMTGESEPVAAAPGDVVLAGTINLDSPITVRVTAAVGDRRIDRILGRMTEVQGEKSEISRFADAVARRLVPLAIGLAAGVGAIGVLAGLPAEAAALRALSVLVIACPCALSIAVPVAYLAFAERGVRRGYLFRSPAAMERAGGLRHLLLDKTGTLTEGAPRTIRVLPAEGVSADRLRDFAATAEVGIDHPIARALVAGGTAGEAARHRHARGVSADLPDGTRIDVGSAAFLVERGIALGPPAATAPEGTRVHVAENGRWIGALDLGDPIRGDAAETVAALGAAGYTLAMVTGDAEAPAGRVADAIGLPPTAVFAGIDPEGKAEVVRRAQATGPTGFAGDGVNDSVALAAADLGIAVDGASHAATAGAGLIISRGGLAAIAGSLALARRARRRMVQNLGFALVYNAAAIPLAATGAIPPSAAAAAMLASSLSVMANATR